MISQFALAAGCLAVLMAGRAEAKIQLDTLSAPPSSKAFSVTFSTDKTDIELVPLGMHSTAQPLAVDFGVSGNSAHHSVSLNIQSDWFNIYDDKSLNNKMTAFLKDNKENRNFDQVDFISVVYGPGSKAGFTYIYLKFDPNYIACRTSSACKAADHTITINVQGGANWISPSDEGGQDSKESGGQLPSNYVEARLVHMADLGVASAVSVAFPTRNYGLVNYLPLGQFHMGDFLSMNIEFAGQGTSHNMRVDIATDYMPVRISDPLRSHKDKMTAFFMDNIRDSNKMEGVELVYRQQPQTSNVWIYLKLPPPFITCGTNQKCIDSNRNLIISPNNPPHSFKAGLADPDFDERNYLTADKVQFAKEVASDAKYNVPLTTEKTDVDMVPLGSVNLMESTSFKIGVTGWGASHSMILDVTTDWFNQEARGNAVDRTTVFVKDTKSHLTDTFEHCTDTECFDVEGQADAYQYWDIHYAASTERNMVYFYLAIDPKYFACDYYAERDNDPAIKVQCEEAAHSVNVHASAGPSYVPGNMEGGFDVDLAANLAKDKHYFKAVKIDVGAIPMLEQALANATAVNAAQDAAIADLTAANVEQDTTIAAQDTTIAAQAQTISDMSDRLAKLEAWVSAAPVPGTKATPSCTGDCSPEVATPDGSALALTATGGAVTFESGGCKVTDLCEMALDVEALKAKFDNN